jgi:hypothetical protein
VVVGGVLLWRMPLRVNDEPVLWERDPPLSRRDGPSGGNDAVLGLGLEMRGDRRP